MEKKMAEDKKEVKKVVKKITKYKISKTNGNVIYRDSLSEAEIKMYKSKKCSVEEV
jgi:hypothetical protein|tara:strand:- start:785 stop:952 length:168 start_codon:yes stop_codon:yes gene_type:complete